MAGVATGYGCGGGGWNSGAAGGVSIAYVTGLTPGGTISVTIGAAGTGYSGSLVGKAGKAGFVLVEY
ncbi:MAG: hypothetical protein WCK82_15585 [Bacteroidota bacterium]